MNKRLGGVLLALQIASIPALAQVGHEVYNTPTIEATNRNTNSNVADFSDYFRVNALATYTNIGSIYWLNTNTAGTFITNGTYTTGTAATDYFGNGTARQAMEINGSSAPIFNNLVFQNGAMNIANSAGITVNRTLTLTNGITTTQRNSPLANSVRINTTNAGAITGDFSDTRHVDGYVSRVMSANTTYDFPVGNGGDYRPVTYRPTAAADFVSVAYLQGTPPQGVNSLGTDLMAVSTVGSWPVSAAVAGAVSVSIPDVSGFTTAQNLRLVGWNGTQWVSLGQTASGTTEGSTLSGTIPAGTTITALGIGSVSQALPVTLGRFDAKFEGTSVLLSWDTYTEINNDYFEVMRSTNLQDWLPLGRVKGQGTTQTKQSYQFIDEKPLGGISYYQLRQVDFDKTRHTSPIRSVKNPYVQEQIGQINIYPNPANNRVLVKIPQISKDVTVQLFNASWQNTKVPAVLKDTHYELNVSQVTPGLYFLQITAGEGSQSVHKLIIQH